MLQYSCSLRTRSLVSEYKGGQMKVRPPWKAPGTRDFPWSEPYPPLTPEEQRGADWISTWVLLPIVMICTAITIWAIFS
jgi:hypothetical protein